MILSKNYNELLKNVYNKGIISSPRGLKIKELINTTIEIENPLECIYSYKNRQYPFKYLSAELIWYMSKNRNIEEIGKYAKLWNNIADENGNTNSNYGYLVFGKQIKGYGTQYEWALNSLLIDINSRQSIIRYNDTDHQYEGNKDFTCTFTNQFFVRGGKLDMIINMRSNDLIYGVTFDLPWFSLIMQSMLNDINKKYKNISLGKMYYNIGSAHIYEKDFEKIELMINEKKPNIFTVKILGSLYDTNILDKELFLKLKNTTDYKNFIKDNFKIGIKMK